MNEKPKVIDSLWTFAVATAVLGPFALPLLWRNPRFKTSTKVIGSIVVTVLTFALLYVFKELTSLLTEKMQELEPK